MSKPLPGSPWFSNLIVHILALSFHEEINHEA